MIRHGKALLVLPVLLTLTGCATMSETMTIMKEKISSISLPSFSSSSPETAAPEMAAVTEDKNCPTVNIVEDLRTIHQLMAGTVAESGVISSAAITGVARTCAQNANNIAVSLTVYFTGKLGPAAQSWTTEQPSFAYPYFVAIADNNGSIIAKEVFASTVSYDKSGAETAFSENMRQIIPIPANDNAPAYQILVGFQLSEEELAYNRSLVEAENPVAQQQPAKLMAPIVEPEKPKKAPEKPFKKAPKPKHKPVTEPAAAPEPEPASEPVPADVTGETQPVDAAAPAEEPAAAVPATDAPLAPATAIEPVPATPAADIAPETPDAAPPAFPQDGAEDEQPVEDILTP